MTDLFRSWLNQQAIRSDTFGRFVRHLQSGIASLTRGRVSLYSGAGIEYALVDESARPMIEPAGRKLLEEWMATRPIARLGRDRVLPQEAAVHEASTGWCAILRLWRQRQFVEGKQPILFDAATLLPRVGRSSQYPLNHRDAERSQEYVICPQCEGKGWILSEKRCSPCNGTGMVPIGASTVGATYITCAPCNCTGRAGFERVDCAKQIEVTNRRFRVYKADGEAQWRWGPREAVPSVLLYLGLRKVFVDTDATKVLKHVPKSGQTAVARVLASFGSNSPFEVPVMELYAAQYSRVRVEHRSQRWWLTKMEQAGRACFIASGI